MAKKTKQAMPQYGSVDQEVKANNNSDFYFGKANFKWMLIGLACIVVGYLLMMGADANTTPDGNWHANYWNEGIFSIRRIRIAPMLVIAGFVIQIYAILKRDKK